MNKRIVFTGGSGKAGKHVVPWLKARGYDILECTLGWDCGTCPDKTVCDDIKEILTVRKRKAA